MEKNMHKIDKIIHNELHIYKVLRNGRFDLD